MSPVSAEKKELLLFFKEPFRAPIPPPLLQKKTQEAQAHTSVHKKMGGPTTTHGQIPCF